MQARYRRGGFSCDGQNFVANQAQANVLGPCAVEEEGSRCFDGALSQLLPGISLNEDILGEALGNVAPISLLDNFEYQFGHISSIRHGFQKCEPQTGVK